MRASLFLAVAAGLIAAGCSPSNVSSEASTQPSVAPHALAHPAIVMEADPPPPFTYWAPEGSTIRNHPHVPGIWNAFLNGRNIASYYGDQCRASDYQRFVGRPVAAMPQLPDGIDLRSSCSNCPVNSDMRANRLNLIFDESSKTILQIACY